jgi:hypothetical protein
MASFFRKQTISQPTRYQKNITSFPDQGPDEIIRVVFPGTGKLRRLLCDEIHWIRESYLQTDKYRYYSQKCVTHRQDENLWPVLIKKFFP